jgi:hypothetical protein
VIVEGGALRDGEVQDQDGQTVIKDAFAEIEKVLAETKGNPKSHSAVLIENVSRYLSRSEECMASILN